MPPSPPSSPAAARTAERRAARQITRTKLGIACGLVALATAAIAITTTLGSISTIVETYGVTPLRPGGTAGQLSPLLLTYLIGAGLAGGGALMLAPKTSGWWLTLVSALLGPLDLFRIYRHLVAAINYDSPRVDEVIRNLTIYIGLPVVFYLALIALLLQRRVRSAYRV